jgi:hypothetical protein
MQCASPASPTNITPASGLEELAEDESHLNAPFSAVWRRAPTAGAYTIAWTLGTSREWRVLTVSFKPLRDLVGALSLGLSTSGQMSLLAPEPHKLPLTLTTRGQIAPHATPMPLRLQTFGLITFAEARAAIQLVLAQTTPAFLTPVAAHADPMSLALQLLGDPGIRGDAALVLAMTGQVGPHASARLVLDTSGQLTIGNAVAAAVLALQTSGVLVLGPSGNMGLALAVAGQLEGSVARGDAALRLAVSGLLQQAARGNMMLALATSGNIPRDAVAAIGLQLSAQGTMQLANNNVAADLFLVLQAAGNPTLNTPNFAALVEMATLWPFSAGIPGGTSYE